MGPPATGGAGTQAAVTALQWICTPLQALRPCGEEQKVGEEGWVASGRATGRRVRRERAHRPPTPGNRPINYASHTMTLTFVAEVHAAR